MGSTARVVMVAVLLVASGLCMPQTIREWIPGHVTDKGKYIPGHYVTRQLRPSAKIGYDHYVPGHWGTDGRYIPGHMVKGRKPHAPATHPGPSGTTGIPRSRDPFLGTPATASVSRVFVTRTGKTYHLETCPHVKGRSTATSMTVSEAQAKGYKPCKTCHPPG